jgi:hypothetical protein
VRKEAAGKSGLVRRFRLRPRTAGQIVEPNEDSEPLPGKGATGSSFEVALKFRGSISVRERGRGFDAPRTELCRVRYLSAVVTTQAVPQIVGQTYIKAFGLRLTLQNVNVREFHF